MKEKYYKVSESELMDLIECRERFNAVYMDGCEGGIVGWELGDGGTSTVKNGTVIV